jgi:hypothetical protein
MPHFKTLIAMAAGLGLLGLIPACPAPQHPDVYEGGAYQGDDDDATGDDDDDTGDDDTAGGEDAALFYEDYIEGTCGLYFECLDPGTLEAMGWETLGDCVSQMMAKAGSMEGCTVDGGYASGCLDDIDSVSCDDFLAGEGLQSCQDAYYTVSC